MYSMKQKINYQGGVFLMMRTAVKVSKTRSVRGKTQKHGLRILNLSIVSIVSIKITSFPSLYKI